MKHILEFDTESENYDYHEHQRYINAQKMLWALEDIREFIRTKIKYTDETIIKLEDLEDKFWEIIKDRGISFEEMGY